MKQTCWNIWPDRGFLCYGDPLTSLISAPLDDDIIAHIEGKAAELPHMLNNNLVQKELDQFPTFDLSSIEQADDFRLVERLMMLYSYFASAYVHMDIHKPACRLPQGIARPLHYLSTLVERPPILDYANYVLTNWQRVDPAGGIAVDNLKLVQQFRDHHDEAWFILIHVDIEARAAGALAGIQEAIVAVKQDNTQAVEAALTNIADSVAAMIQTFERMPEKCDPDVYYYKVRPYIFLFQDVMYEGVDAYNAQPQTFRGQTGAQSSIIPALVEALGLEHEQSGLTHHLRVMRDYMPKPHREFLQQVHGSPIRDFVKANQHHGALRDVYNTCLKNVLEFRRLHLHYATEYIAKKVEDPTGTGGTIFMNWLGQLVEETEKQLV